jgi:histidyl-tRNA synthetase
VFENPRGTRDILAEEMIERKGVEASLRSSFESFGYKEVQTPVFEHLELFTAKSGEEIVGHLYSFEDRAGRRLALRPELSAPTIRLYVNELRNKPKPRKLFYFENCFRYERPQKGRYREFWQAGVELIGSARPEAEAEVIALAVHCLENLNLKKYSISIGHLGIIRSLLSTHGIAEDLQNHLISLIDRGEKKDIEKLVPREVKSKLLGLVGLKGTKEQVFKEAESILGKNVGNELSGFRECLEILELYGVHEFIVDLGIARGLDYYSGMVFEIRAKGLGAQDQICGGGTYSLAKLLGGGDVPSCGFAFGFDRLMLSLKTHGIIPQPERPSVFVAPTSRKMLNRAIEITNFLRKEITCDLDLMRRKLDKSLSYANSEGISHVLIVSEDVKGDSVILRDMRNGEQKLIELKEVPDAVK